MNLACFPKQTASSSLVGNMEAIHLEEDSGALDRRCTCRNKSSGYMDDPLRRISPRAGYAHAGVIVILSLVCQMLADGVFLPSALLWAVRIGVPLSAILVSSGFSMTRDVRMMSGITLVTVPTIQYGGYFLLSALMNKTGHNQGASGSPLIPETDTAQVNPTLLGL